MSAAEWAVLVAGVAAVAWVNWYFFIASGRAAAARPNASGKDEVVVVVDGGYEPSVIRVKTGRPVRLTFDRRETNSCSDEIVIPDFGIRKFLPAFQRTTIEITPKVAGRYPLSCGMSMLHGTIVAE